jgi:hypothetical protein
MVSSNTETNITVSYDDSDNTLDFVIGTLNQDTTGLAATATALATARTIHGVSFDGTANIDLTEVVQDTVGAMFTSNTESGITVAYQDADGTVDFTVGTLNQDTTGLAATATALATARTIGGTSFDGTANIAVNLSATATALATARTIGGVSFDGTANIVPTTFNAATFSGDLNVDSGVLFADVSTNRVGINQTSPDVSLDLGSNTDSIHVPVGTTAQRPASPAAGYFRYNSTTGGFEGYTDAWGAIAGGSGGGTAPAINTMTGDGSDTTLTLTSAPANENATVVTIDGVVQHKDTYAVSGTTLTFSEAPPTGTKVECITWTNTAVNSALLMQDADGDTKIQVEESSDEDKIRFDTGGTERMIIDSSGRLLIGTDSGDAFNDDAMLRLQRQGDRVFQSFKVDADQEAAIFFGDVDDDVECGIQYQAANRNLIFSTGNNAEALRIDSSGNVGIGTSSPTEKLTVNGALAITGALADDRSATAAMDFSSDVTRFISYGASSTHGQFAFRTATTGASSTERVRINHQGNISFGAQKQDPSISQFFNGITGNYGSGLSMQNNGYAVLGLCNNFFINSSSQNQRVLAQPTQQLQLDHLGNFLFQTAASGTAGGTFSLSEKMRLDVNGTVKVGTTSTVYSGGEIMSISSTTEGLGIKTTTATKQCLGLYNSDAGGARHFVRFALGSSGTEVGNITSTGSTTAYNTSSDARLKDVTGSARGLEVINKLNPVAYNWKADGQADEGLIAQEVLDIVPNAVSGSEEEMYQMDYSKLVVHLVKGMKEQQTQIDALQSEINNLKGE